ncbi:MAG: ABC transporter substrate-binding protein [Dehalococcoidia bacterium]|nr:ABC transporter substrate-binding protein [Dehalococcoidia bacterium]
MRTRSRLWEQLLMALVVGLLALVLLLVGCSTKTSQPASEPSGDEKAYGNIAFRTSLTRNIAGSLDPHIPENGLFIAMTSSMFDTVLQLTPEGKIGPGLAERWEVAPDGLTHTFFIRKGVKFHDGSDLTAADVKFSLDRVIAGDGPDPNAVAWRSVVTSVDLKDDYTVAMRLKSPQFDLMRGFGYMAYSSSVVPKKYIEEKGVDYFSKNPIGSGPWKFVRYFAGSHLEVEAVESHWKAVPKFKNLKLVNVPEEATVVAMLKTGELDIANISPDSAPDLKAAGLNIIDYKGGEQYVMYLFYDVEHPGQQPIGDIRVRKALSLGIDRKEMSNQLMRGYAEPSAVWRIPSSVDYYDSSVLKADPYDPEGAKKLLTEAGYPTGFNMKLWSAGSGATNVKDLAVAGYWRKIGVNAEVVAREESMIISLYNPRLTPEIYNTGVGKNSAAGAGYGFDMMTVFHSKKSVVHNTKNLKLDDLIDKVMATPQGPERKKLSLEALVIARDELTFVPVLDYHTIVAIGAKVGKLTTVSGMGLNGYNAVTATHAK